MFTDVLIIPTKLRPEIYKLITYTPTCMLFINSRRTPTLTYSSTYSKKNRESYPNRKLFIFTKTR